MKKSVGWGSPTRMRRAPNGPWWAKPTLRTESLRDRQTAEGNRVRISDKVEANLFDPITYTLASYTSGQTAQAATIIKPTLPDLPPTIGSGRKKRR